MTRWNSSSVSNSLKAYDTIFQYVWEMTKIAALNEYIARQRHSRRRRARRKSTSCTASSIGKTVRTKQKRKKFGKVFCVVIVMLIASSDRLLYLVFEWNVPINAIYAVQFRMVRNSTSFLHFKYFLVSRRFCNAWICANSSCLRLVSIYYRRLSNFNFKQHIARCNRTIEMSSPSLETMRESFVSFSASFVLRMWYAIISTCQKCGMHFIIVIVVMHWWDLCWDLSYLLWPSVDGLEWNLSQLQVIKSISIDIHIRWLSEFIPFILNQSQ